MSVVVATPPATENKMAILAPSSVVVGASDIRARRTVESVEDGKEIAKRVEDLICGKADGSERQKMEDLIFRNRGVHSFERQREMLAGADFIDKIDFMAIVGEHKIRDSLLPQDFAFDVHYLKHWTYASPNFMCTRSGDHLYKIQACGRFQTKDACTPETSGLSSCRLQFTKNGTAIPGTQYSFPAPPRFTDRIDLAGYEVIFEPFVYEFITAFTAGDVFSCQLVNHHSKIMASRLTGLRIIVEEQGVSPFPILHVDATTRMKMPGSSAAVTPLS